MDKSIVKVTYVQRDMKAKNKEHRQTQTKNKELRLQKTQRKKTKAGKKEDKLKLTYTEGET